ncbi:MAG: oligopeptide/dipeptide ABC transporter ATP-binding protein, partial [Actinomycetota bacterium]
HMSDRIIVMYLGVIAEIGRAEEVFRDPRHPYTEALLAANPSMHDEDDAIRLQGSVPDPAAPPQGCRFHTRCPVAIDACGWDISDALRILEDRGHVLDGLRGVERSSPFEGVLSFEDPDQARGVEAELQSDRVPAAFRGAAELVQARDRALHIRLRPIEEMSVHAVGGEHHTACLLHRPDDAVAE